MSLEAKNLKERLDEFENGNLRIEYVAPPVVAVDAAALAVEAAP